MKLYRVSQKRNETQFNRVSRISVAIWSFHVVRELSLFIGGVRPCFNRLIFGEGQIFREGPLFFKTNVACTVCSFLPDAGHIQGL